MSDRVPIVSGRSWKEIEGIATGIIAAFYPQCLEIPQPVPVDHFVEIILPKHYGVEFNLRPELPPFIEGVLMPASSSGPARLYLSEETYEQMLAGDGRARYTAGHEGGHAVLHSDELQQMLVSGKLPGLHRKSAIAPFCNPERQADVFAARLLMPRPMMIEAVKQFGLDVGKLAATFCVSWTAVEIRLRELGLTRVPRSAA